MVSRPRSWWQKIRKPLLVVGVIVLLVGLVALIYVAYQFKWDWTGFNQHLGPNTLQYQPSKTLWDWLQLLIIPVVLAVGGYLFKYTASRNGQKSTQLRDQTERDIAADNQREAALQANLDKMSELLLANHLRESAEDEEVRKIARVRTLTVLPRLDNERKRNVLLFLHESGLIDKNKHIVTLIGATLRGADLSKATLSKATLRGADLSGADLRAASLSGADLRGAFLIYADLRGADLHGASLSGAIVTSEQLDTALLLIGTILPDGSKHP